MKKFLAYFILISFIVFVGDTIAKTLDDFILEGYTKRDLEKGFIEISGDYYSTFVPIDFPNSEFCNEFMQCGQLKWKRYCSGAIFQNYSTNMIIITLDRCGYPDGQNRKYPPTEAEINRFLETFSDIDEVLSKNPGLVIREKYLEELEP